MKTRLDLLDSIPKDGIAAELGTFGGDFAAEILKRCEPSLLYVVDSFDGEIQSGDENGENMRTLDMGLQYGVLKQRYQDNPHVCVIKELSWDWLAAMPDCCLDFAYADTSHTHLATTRELAGMWRVVKPGGYIAGHDWSPAHFPGVVMAVAEFCEQHSLTKEIFRGDKLHSFLIQKPTGFSLAHLLDPEGHPSVL